MKRLTGMFLQASTDVLGPATPYMDTSIGMGIHTREGMEMVMGIGMGWQ